jgi:hypothetical protein
MGTSGFSFAPVVVWNSQVDFHISIPMDITVDLS